MIGDCEIYIEKYEENLLLIWFKIEFVKLFYLYEEKKIFVVGFVWRIIDMIKL